MLMVVKFSVLPGQVNIAAVGESVRSNWVKASSYRILHRYLATCLQSSVDSEVDAEQNDV